VHSTATSHAYWLSSIEPQNDHVIGELPVQHPGSAAVGVEVGHAVPAGDGVSGDGVGDTTGGGVNTQSSGSSVTTHEHTPLYSQVPSVTNPEQNELVAPEYPIQHPSSSSVGDGVVDVVVNKQSSGSSVTIQSQLAAASQPRALSFKLLQNASYGASP
jgi:hypothetical protein